MKPQIPFGIISVKHFWINSYNYYKTSFTLLVEYEPKIRAAYFWAQQFWFHGGDGGYFGIQSDGDINGSREKIAIFSIWKSIGAIKSNHAKSSAESFGHEGSGFSCKIPFAWKEGCVYKLELIRQSSADDTDTSSWQAYITDTGSSVTSLIGTINVPSDWGNLKPQSNFFVEYFRSVGSCQDTPFEKSVYGNLIMTEDKEIQPLNSSHETYGECANIGLISKTGNSFVIETGQTR